MTIPAGRAVSDLPPGYDPLRRSVAWGDPGLRTTLVIRGVDAVRFVDGFTTAAVSRLAVGDGTEGFFTDAKGWVITAANIMRVADGVWIDASAGVAPRLIEHLEHYHIREQFEIVDESGTQSSFIVGGPGAGAWLTSRLDVTPPARRLAHVTGRLGDVAVRVARVDRYGSLDFLVQVTAAERGRLIGWLAAQQVAWASPEALEMARIETGSLEAVDIPERTLPQELGRDVQAIAFDKGCYLGQETVARIDALGHVNRRLVAVAFNDASPVSAGGLVTSAGQPVGMLTSRCRSGALGRGIGLGLIQVKAIDGRWPLVVDGAEAAIVPLPVQTPAGAAEPVVAGGQGEGGDAGTLLVRTRRFSVVRVSEPCIDGGSRDREIVRHPGSVVIVPMVTEHEVCLVEVVRVAVGQTLLELPAGTLDRVETLEDAARRELAEETGYRAASMTAAGVFWMSPGILRERMHLFLAEELVSGPQALEPGEQIRTRVVAWQEAVAMCMDGRIEDAKTVAGILLVDGRRRARHAP